MQAKDSTPDLKFRSGVEETGFEPKNMAVSIAKSAPIVRELIQNALDAAQEISQPAEVEFQIEKHLVEEIPGIRKYRRVLERALETQGKNPGGTQWQKVATDMKKASNQKEVSVLFILDNGIGLDPKRMQSLLADGQSTKEKGAGSYGVGHLEAFAASEMRYILYGGLYRKNGGEEMIASGFTQLAGWWDKEGNPWRKEGYYVTALKKDKGDIYEFPRNDEIPDFLKKKLTLLRKKWQTGSVIAIIAFNNFRENENAVGKAILEAAARNFFIAIDREDLKISVRQSEGKVSSLTQDELGKVLEEGKTQKGTPRDGIGLSGERAYKAYQTWKDPDETPCLDKGYGPVNCSLRDVPEEDRSRINLYRNGMWVTHERHEKQLKECLSDYKPLNIVMRFEGDSEASNLIRRAEKPSHTGPLQPTTRLNRKERGEYKKLFQGLIEGLKDQATGLPDAEEYTLDDYMLIDLEDELGKRRPELMPDIPPESRRESEKPNPPIPPVPPTPRPNPPGGKNAKVNASVRRDTDRPLSCQVMIQPEEKVEALGVRLSLGNGGDQTCDLRLPSNFLVIKKAVLDGVIIKPDGLYEIPLLKHSEKELRILEIELEKELPVDCSITVDVVRRSTRHKTDQ